MWYKLVGRNIKYVGDITKMENAKEYSKDVMNYQNRRIALEHISPDVYVSSVFLGLDHSLGVEDSPVLFESMVFGLEDGPCYRTKSWIETYYMHIVSVELAIHTLLNSSEAFKSYTLSRFVYNNEIVDVTNVSHLPYLDGIRLIVDDGVNQPPISFGLFNNIFYKRTLLDPDSRVYNVKWWELGDPECDIIGEVGPYLEYLPKFG
jgi:hypothetical protein